MYIYDSTSLNSSQHEKYFTEKVVEKIKTHIKIPFTTTTVCRMVCDSHTTRHAVHTSQPEILVATTPHII